MRPLALFMTLFMLLLTACGGPEEAPTPPPPAVLSSQAVGYLCKMMLSEHAGPKAQLFVRGQAAPLWFSSVRDLFAYRLMPEENQSIAALYVSDMGKAAWEQTGDMVWIDATTAHYVIGSSRLGGMGGAEVVPFADPLAADQFIAQYGGKRVSFTEVPRDYIFHGFAGIGMAPP